MDLRSHMSPEEQRFVDNYHGTERFRQLVILAWNAAVFHGIKRMIPKEYHPQFTLAWHRQSHPGNRYHGIADHVANKVAELMDTADNRTGGHAQKGMAWADQKGTELWTHVTKFIA